MSPKVSIVIPIHNAGKNLYKCLDSLSAQTLRDIEIICVLDCPTDGSDTIAKAYAKKDIRIVIIENTENQHIGESRNIGLKTAIGKYVTFCDHDDVVAPNFLEIMVAIAERNNSFIVGSYDSYYQKNIQPSGVISCDTKQAYIDLLSGKATLHSPSVWTYLYEREFLIRNQIIFVDTRKVSVEDRLFNTEVMACLINEGIKHYFCATQHLYFHGIEHTNSNYSYRRFENILAFFEKMGHIDLIVEKKTETPKNLNTFIECIARFLYLSLRFEIKQNGLIPSVKKLSIIKNYPLVWHSLKNYKTIYNKNLTPPKNIFVALLKKI